MDNLRKIISQLSTKDFNQIKSSLVKNDSKKFLYVLIAYRKNKVSDESIMKTIRCSIKSFYVLKSRLLDKIQELLVKTTGVEETADLQDSNSLMQYVCEYPREMATAILHQLEKKCIINDVPQELISVYSALKKVYFYSDKYYHYSQLYNKQIAYTIALEKSEDLLFNFNKALATYFFSKTDHDKEIVFHFIKEIKNIYSLNQSHRFELIKIFILIEASLFADIECEEEHLEDLIKKCEQITSKYSNDKQIRYYNLVVDYFWFEYYYKLNQFKKAEQYLKVLETNGKIWLLMNNYCPAFKFLLTKPELLLKLNSPAPTETEEIYSDKYDFYTLISIKFSKAINALYRGNIKESSENLFDLTCDISFNHFFHFEIEIKLTLAYLYIKQNKHDKADELITSISRKINDGKKAKYLNALLFIKILNLLMGKSKASTSKNKLEETIHQFNYYNKNETKILSFLQPEIESIIEKQLG